MTLSIGTFLVASEGSLLDISLPTILWSWVTFGATLWALSRIAWPMLQRKMEEREIRIREGLEKAEEAERRAAELVEKQGEILNEAREEAHQLLTETRATAEHIRGESLAQARNEIAAERERARKEIAQERARAVAELKRAAVELTLEAAGRVLEREITDEDHRRLAGEVIDRVEGL